MKPRKKPGNEHIWRWRERSLQESKVWHAHLIHVLGGQCCECGDSGNNSPLTIDHVMGRKWNLRGIRMDERVKRYWAEFKEGVYLRVLCHLCNSAGGTGMAMFYAS